MALPLPQSVLAYPKLTSDSHRRGAKVPLEQQRPFIFPQAEEEASISMEGWKLLWKKVIEMHKTTGLQQVTKGNRDVLWQHPTYHSPSPYLGASRVDRGHFLRPL